MTNKYEAVLIYSVLNKDEAAIAAMVEKFKALIEANGTVEGVDEWGKRRLAYLIDDETEGYYAIYTFESAPEFPAELERLFNIDENVMRSLVLRLEYEAVAKAAPAPAEESAVAEVAEAVEAPAADAEA